MLTHDIKREEGLDPKGMVSSVTNKQLPDFDSTIMTSSNKASDMSAQKPDNPLPSVNELSPLKEPPPES